MKSKKLSMPIMAHNQVLYFGLAMLDRCLAISVTYNTIFESRAWLIQLFTRCGKLKRQIICKDLFQKPEYLASNAEEDILYISDGVANAVHAMNPRGCVLFTFTSDTMYAPRGLSVDLDGHIYVACDQGVIQIHKDCGKNRMLLRLLDNQTGIETVFFDRKLNCIVIFGKNCSQASVFKFADQLKKQELEE
ncbi:hypothetical protein DPMN_031776 [Dreissena polymorpha]|uniref:SMP-30/Gluconolactonase/LRE-like region domain-containing protein n=1 Tax=Dreissena polymorpha TaxID=45954 RepID=A0A9D4M0L9_DREPO|nr:hypothetical protein DPMN_031776 [Dreissena polymorpha]